MTFERFGELVCKQKGQKASVAITNSFHRRYSSVVERALRKRTVVGSIPTGGCPITVNRPIAQARCAKCTDVDRLKNGFAGV